MTDLHLKVKKQLGCMQVDVDLRLPSRGVSAIFGRSGAGKTTLINLFSGLEQPDSGYIKTANRVLFDSEQGINIPVERRRIGYVFQEARLFPHYRVRGNLTYGVSVADDDYFTSIVSLLGLNALLERYPHDLSGGEKQRVAIGRALLSKPDLLLMDEPLASLDLPRKREVMPFLERLGQQINIPILYVTHSMSEILRLADHLVLLDQGRERLSGPIEQVWSSSLMRPWQSFSEQSTLLVGNLTHHRLDYGLSYVALSEQVGLWVQQIEDAVEGQRVRLQIRATDVSVARQFPQATSIRNILPVKITRIEHLQQGEIRKSVALQLTLADGCWLWSTITEWALQELGLHVGMQVYAQIKGVSVTQRDIVVTHT